MKTFNIQKALEGDESIDAEIEDFENIEPQLVRDYLERYNSKLKEEDWKTYTKEDIQKYTSIKAVLTHRAQFNTRKKEVYKRLCANFDVTREYEIPTKISEKEKKKRKVNQRGSDQDSISKWEKWKADY